MFYAAIRPVNRGCAYRFDSALRQILIYLADFFSKPRSKTQYCTIFSPEWVKTWVVTLHQILRPTFSRQKRKKRPEISRFQVFYGCGGRTRTCGLRVMSCSEAPIPCDARVSRLFYPQKSGKTRRPNEFAPRPTSGLSRKWVGIWVRADSGQLKKWSAESKKSGNISPK